MPLPVLLALVVFGIAGIAVLTHFLGYSRTFALDTDDAVHAQWLRHWPDDQVTRILRSEDGHAALVQSQKGAGVIWSFGADTTARRIRDANPSPCKRGLRIDLHDFTAPHVTIALSPQEVRVWQDEIERMNR